MPQAYANGINLYYEEHGNGFPLVLAHGFGATCAMWKPQVAAFSRRYRLITYDVRGHGQSDCPDDPSLYSREALVEDLYQLLHHLGVKEAVIGGLSMGGIIAQHFYFHHPEVVRALILANTGPGYRDAHHMAEADRSREETSRVLEQQGMRAFARSRPGTTYWVPRKVLLAQNPIALSNVNKKIMSNLTMLPLERISVPTLIISSTQDIQLLPAAEHMKRYIPNSLLCMIPNAGHGSNSDQPGLFNQIVLQWLAELKI